MPNQSLKRFHNRKLTIAIGACRGECMIPFSLTSLKKAWRGEEKLWLAFWVYFVAVFISWWLLFSVWKLPVRLWDQVFFNPPNAINLYIAILFWFLGDTLIRIYQIVSVWRCAPNSSLKLWTWASRSVVACFALVTIYGSVKTLLHIVKHPL